MATNFRRSTTKLIYACSILIVVLLSIPTTDVVAPYWDVLVTDQANQPLSGVSVSENSQQYTVESHDHELQAITGFDGKVHFPLRLIHATGWHRFLGTIGNIVGAGAHASFGVHTWIYASKAGYDWPLQLDLFTRNDIASHADGSHHQSSHLTLVKCAPGYGKWGSCLIPYDDNKPILPFPKR